MSTAVGQQHEGRSTTGGSGRCQESSRRTPELSGWVCIALPIGVIAEFTRHLRLLVTSAVAALGKPRHDDLTVVPAIDGSVFNGARATRPLIGGAPFAGLGFDLNFRFCGDAVRCSALIAAW